MRFELEKVLHEIIRDLPEAARIERLFKAGTVSNADAFQMITDLIKIERAKAGK